MIRIVDDFFPDPFRIRSIALESKYPTRDPNYPGERFAVDNNTRDFALKLMREHLPNATLSDRENHGMGFNFIDASYVAGMCHADQTFSRYNCIVYLTPDPPLETGIEIYDNFMLHELKHPSHINKCAKVKEKFFQSSRNPIDKFFYKRYGIEESLKYQKNKIEVSNKFNRMVLVPSERIHRPQNYFGKYRRDCRLTLTTFLD